MKEGLLSGFCGVIPYGTSGVGASLGEVACVVTVSFDDGMVGGTLSCVGDWICPFDPYITGPCEYCIGVG